MFRFHLWVLEFGFQGSGFTFGSGYVSVCRYFFIRGWVGFFVLVFRNFWVLTFLNGGKVVVNLFARLLLLDIHWKKCCCWDTHLEHSSRARTSISKNFYYYIGETVEVFLHRFILKDKFSSWGELWWNELGNPLIDFLFQEFRKSWLLLFCISYCLWH